MKLSGNSKQDKPPEALQASAVKSHMEEAHGLKLWDSNIADGPKQPTTDHKTIL